jgi:hypothetical protein
MFKYSLVLSMIVMVSSLPGKTIRADVTGDGIDDIVKMGMKMVTVQDGASNRLSTIIAGIEDLGDISVGNYFEGTKGNEIAILRLPEKSYFTEVYGYRNKRFIKVSDELPGELSFDESGHLFGYATHAWDRNEVLIYWPIVESGGYLKAAPVAQFEETTLVVNAHQTKTLEIYLLEGTFTMCVASTLGKDVVVFLLDADGTLIKQTMIDARTGFYGRVITDRAKRVTFNVDNAQSGEDKTIHVIIKQYQYH